MSVWNDRFHTLAADDLASQTYSRLIKESDADGTFGAGSARLKESGADGPLRTENARLKDENRQLRQCLVSMSENATLRTAHVLASLLVWSDEQLTGQAKKFLATDALNNNNAKLKPPKAVSPFRPISPGPTQQSSQYIHDPPKQYGSTMSHGSNQYASVAHAQKSQYTSGAPQQMTPPGSVPNQQSQQSSDLLHQGNQYIQGQIQHGNQYTQGHLQESNLLIAEQDISQQGAQHLRIPGASQKETPRRYSPRNYTDVPAVVLMPSSPSPATRCQSSRSPVPPNRSPVPRSRSPAQPAMSGNRSTIQPPMPAGQSRNTVLTPTLSKGSARSYTDRERSSLRNATEPKLAGRTSNPKYPDSASSFDDRLEKLLSRQIAPGEYTTMSATGQGQGFEMPGSSFTAGVGDRRVATSGVLDQTGSEGYGSVPSNLGQFGGDQSERVYSGGIQSGPDVGQYGGGLAGATSNPASVARKAVGDPVATSTPARPSKPGSTADGGLYADSLEQSRSSQQQSNTASRITASSNVLHRPIDIVIGFKPTLTESRCQKLAKIKASTRLVGEIAFQLDRRILEYVFSRKFVSDKEKRKRYYGYSIANTGQMIRKEASDGQGKVNIKKELEMRYRFDYIMKTLSSFGYILDKHGQFAQDMVNKYGLLNAPPDKQTVKDFGLEDPVILRVLLSKLLRSDAELQDELVLLDCLCLLAHDDRKPIFLW